MASYIFTIIPIAITLLITIWRFIHTDEQKLGRKHHRQQALVTTETSDSRSSSNNNYNDNRKYGNNILLT